jgi:spore maturation protein SpmA
MALNYIWVGFFLISFVIGLYKFIFLGDFEVFPAMVQATFDRAKLGFEISIGLTGVMTLWLGIMQIGKEGGAINVLTRLVSPFFRELFPEIPKNHPAMGSILMNFSANMLGLDNAATPLGLQAMKEMHTLNPKKDTASNAQIMFLVLNTSGLTIIPVSVMTIRSQMGAANPSDIFIPILLSTFFASLAGIFVVAAFQKINLLKPVVLVYLGGITIFLGSFMWYLTTLSQEVVQELSLVGGNVIIFSIIIAFILLALRKKINVYETFIDGAKEGFKVAITIIPYLIAILVAIGVFTASGAMEMLIGSIEFLVSAMGIDSDFVRALPTALMKPLSGGGARGMMVEAMETSGVDSFVGRLAATLQGSTDTTFYILAVYFGAVKIKNTRYALTCGLIADLVGIIAAIVIAYFFFH